MKTKERKPWSAGVPLLGTVSHTPRGFEIIHFKDKYGESCSLQQSSFAEYKQPGISAVWLGLDNPDTRMHLDREQVEGLIKHLTKWLNDGTFEGA